MESCYNSLQNCQCMYVNVNLTDSPKIGVFLSRPQYQTSSLVSYSLGSTHPPVEGFVKHPRFAVSIVILDTPLFLMLRKGGEYQPNLYVQLHTIPPSVVKAL